MLIVFFPIISITFATIQAFGGYMMEWSLARDLDPAGSNPETY